MIYESTKYAIHPLKNISISRNNHRNHSLFPRDASEELSLFPIEDDASLENPQSEIIDLIGSFIFEIGYCFCEIAFREAIILAHTKRRDGIITDSENSEKEQDRGEDKEFMSSFHIVVTLIFRSPIIPYSPFFQANKKLTTSRMVSSERWILSMDLFCPIEREASSNE